MMSRSRWSLSCALLALLASSSVLHKAAARSLLTPGLQQAPLLSLTQEATTSAATSPIAEFVHNGGPVPSKGRTEQRSGVVDSGGVVDSAAEGDVAAASRKPGRPGYAKKKAHKLYLYAWYVCKVNHSFCALCTQLLQCKHAPATNPDPPLTCRCGVSYEQAAATPDSDHTDFIATMDVSPAMHTLEV